MLTKLSLLRNFRLLKPVTDCGQITRRLSKEVETPKEQNVQLGDYKIHYELVGNGKHHVLFIPGALGWARQDFSSQLDKMNRSKFTLIGWDPPGYGHSRPPDRRFPSDFFHEDASVAAKLLKELNVSKCSVVGWSDGGITALIFAAQNPDLMNKLVVFGANAYVSEKDIQLYEAVRDINKWSQKMKKPMIDMYGEEYFKKTWNEWIDAMTSIFKNKHGDICRKEVKQIKVPTLIIHGKKDPMVPRYHPIFLKENIHSSKLIEWEDAKHNLHMQHAEEFNSTVEKFLLS